jgi:hypothetical protein
MGGRCRKQLAGRHARLTAFPTKFIDIIFSGLHKLALDLKRKLPSSNLTSGLTNLSSFLPLGRRRIRDFFKRAKKASFVARFYCLNIPLGFGALVVLIQTRRKQFVSIAK